MNHQAEQGEDTPEVLRTLQAPANASHRHKVRRKVKASRPLASPDQPWIVRAIMGIHVPAVVAGAARAFAVAAFTALAEVLLTRLGVLKPSDWQAALPAVASSWFVLAGALDQWAKGNASAAAPTK